MKIGVAGPISLDLLDPVRERGVTLPATYAFPLIANLVNEYLKRGHMVSVFALSFDVERPEVHEFGSLTVHIGRYRRRARYRMLDYSRRERTDLRRAMNDSGCEVIHAHWTYEFALAALESRIPSVITVHDWAPEILRQFRDLYRFYRLTMQFQVLVRSSVTTGPSPYIVERLNRWPGSAVATLVPNGIPASSIGAPRGHARFGTSMQARLLSVANGFSHYKNIPPLLSAFRLLRQTYPNSALRLVGMDMGPGEVAERYARANGLARGVEFVGQVPQKSLNVHYDWADVLVHSSLEESFGMTVVEAMARGVPVVGGVSSGAVPWLLDDGQAGVLVDVSCPTSIAAGVRSLLQCSQTYLKYSEAGWARARRFFSMETVAMHYEEVLERAERERAESAKH